MSAQEWWTTQALPDAGECCSGAPRHTLGPAHRKISTPKMLSKAQRLTPTRVASGTMAAVSPPALGRPASHAPAPHGSLAAHLARAGHKLARPPQRRAQRLVLLRERRAQAEGSLGLGLGAP